MAIRKLAHGCLCCALSASLAFSLTPLMAYAETPGSNQATESDDIYPSYENGDSAVLDTSYEDSPNIDPEYEQSEFGDSYSNDISSQEASQKTITPSADEIGIALTSDSTTTVSAGWNKWRTLEWKVDDDGCFTLRPLGGEPSATFNAYGYWAEDNPYEYFDLGRIYPNATSFKIEGNIACSSTTRAYVRFSNCTSLKSVDLTGLDLSAGSPCGISFKGCSSLASINMTKVKLGDKVDAEEMFRGCASLSSIDLSSFESCSLSGVWSMFMGCSSMTSIDLSSMHFSEDVNVSNMFSGCTALTQIIFPASGMSISNATQMFGHSYSSAGSYDACESLKSLDLSGVDFSSATSLRQMFAGCRSLASLDLKGIDFSSATDASGMFAGCTALVSLDLSDTKFGEINTSSMFAGCTALRDATFPSSGIAISNAQNMFGYTSTYDDNKNEHRQSCESLESVNLSSVDFSGATSARNMFAGCRSLASLDLKGIDFSSVTDASGMFAACAKMKNMNFSEANFSSATDMSNMFRGCESLESLDLSDAEFHEAANAACMFQGCTSLKNLQMPISGMSISNATSMFGSGYSSYGYGYDGASSYGCESLTSLDLSGVDFSDATSVRDMFNGCRSLTHLNLDRTDFSDVADASRMFNGCMQLKEVDLSGFCPPSNVSLSNMFFQCYALASITWPSDKKIKASSVNSMFWSCEKLASLDLSCLDTSDLTDMSYMFCECKSLTSIDLSNFSTDKVRDMSWMFYDCKSLKSINVSSFNTSKATTMNGMFSGCTSLEYLNLSNFDTSNVDSMSSMLGWKGLKSVTLGENFSFNGLKEERQCSLPTYYSYEGYTGKWVSSADGKAYASNEIPNNVAATYTAQKKIEYQIDRIAGDDAYDTNYQTIVRDVELNGSPKGVIVCNTGHYIDSLSAAALSGLLGYPIMLVDGTASALNSAAVDSMELMTNDGTSQIDVVILGGRFAITEAIESQLSTYDDNGACTRLAGDDGYDTNKAVYEYGTNINGGWNSSEVLVATGGGFYDALGSGSYAAANKSFILLANPASDNDKLVELAKNHSSAIIVGGTAAVSSKLESSLRSAGLTISRLAGDDAFDTNILTVKYALKKGMSLEGAGFSTGSSYYDALGSSHLLGSANSVMFLTSTNQNYNEAIYGMLSEVRGTLAQGRIFGGTAAVDKITEWSITDAATGR